MSNLQPVIYLISERLQIQQQRLVNMEQQKLQILQKIRRQHCRLFMGSFTFNGKILHQLGQELQRLRQQLGQIELQIQQERLVIIEQERLQTEQQQTIIQQQVAENQQRQVASENIKETFRSTNMIQDRQAVIERQRVAAFERQRHILAAVSANIKETFGSTNMIQDIQAAIASIEQEIQRLVEFVRRNGHILAEPRYIPLRLQIERQIEKLAIEQKEKIQKLAIGKKCKNFCSELNSIN